MLSSTRGDRTRNGVIQLNSELPRPSPPAFTFFGSEFTNARVRDLPRTQVTKRSIPTGSGSTHLSGLVAAAKSKFHPALGVVAAAPAAPKEVTGSVTNPAAAQASATPPKVEVGRLPTVEGWILRDVANGGALIEGRQGVYEVYAGDPVPGLGRIDAIRRQDGRWVVVTSKGLIVAR